MEFKLGQIIKFKHGSQIKKGKLIRFYYDFKRFPIYIKLKYQPNVWVQKIDVIAILSKIQNKLKWAGNINVV